LFSLVVFFSLVFSFSGLLVTTTLAQVTSGSLTGIVSDPSGAVIPGARVVPADTNKGYDYPTTTDAVGRYLITQSSPQHLQAFCGGVGVQDLCPKEEC
jgi:hypothetical protein